MKNILVTGGCGFIGSNFIRFLLNETDAVIVNLDKLTYAGSGGNIEHMGLSGDLNYRLEVGDICNSGLVGRVFEEHKPELVFHFAAESHVDRSLRDADLFERTNVRGTEVLLDAAEWAHVKRFVYISTDEVYGSIQHGSFSEDAPLNPSNHYAKTKARAEGKAREYLAKGLSVIITRSANNYGLYQFPEKVLPRFITNLIDGKKVPLMWSAENPGLNVRDWLHVEDNCRAIWLVAEKGKEGEVYNISGDNELKNIEMTRILLDIFGYGEEMIERISHRQSHDFRYAIDGGKLNKLGFKYKHRDVVVGFREVVEWYRGNRNWWDPLKEKAEALYKK